MIENGTRKPTTEFMTIQALYIVDWSSCEQRNLLLGGGGCAISG